MLLHTYNHIITVGKLHIRIVLYLIISSGNY